MRTIVVTGSASGIGAATRARLEADGHHVIGVDLADAEVTADLSLPEGRQAALAGIAEAASGSIDGFVGYAGVGPTAHDVALLTTLNYFGQIDLLDGVRALLAAGTDPSAVAVSSIAATISPVDEAAVDAMVAGDEALAVKLTREHNDAGVAYSTSKLAVARAARRRAVEWIGQGIRLNVLAPGNARTPMTDAALADAHFGPLMKAIPVPAGRWAEPDEIAEAACWLLSGNARYLVGSVLVVDGGIDCLVRPDAF